MPSMSRFFAVARCLPKSAQAFAAEFGVTVGLIAAVYYVATAIRS
jgi:hypothetical protein